MESAYMQLFLCQGVSTPRSFLLFPMICEHEQMECWPKPLLRGVCEPFPVEPEFYPNPLRALTIFVCQNGLFVAFHPYL